MPLKRGSEEGLRPKWDHVGQGRENDLMLIKARWVTGGKPHASERVQKAFQ